MIIKKKKNPSKIDLSREINRATEPWVNLETKEMYREKEKKLKLKVV